MHSPYDANSIMVAAICMDPVRVSGNIKQMGALKVTSIDSQYSQKAISKSLGFTCFTGKLRSLPPVLQDDNVPMQFGVPNVLN